MRKIILLVLVCLMLSSCETLKEIQNNEALNKVGSFELNPAPLNSYWYNGRSYEYNEYEIKITAEPVQAQIEWDGKAIGKTPFTYRFSGTLDVDDYVKVRAIPMGGDFPAQEAALRVRSELPREIHFKLIANGTR